MQLRGNWNYPTAIRFGAGRISELADAVQKSGIRRPLLVTDPVLAALPMVAAAKAALDAAGMPCAVFSDVKPNPVAANVEEGIKVLLFSIASMQSLSQAKTLLSLVLETLQIGRAHV